MDEEETLRVDSKHQVNIGQTTQALRQQAGALTVCPGNRIKEEVKRIDEEVETTARPTAPQTRSTSDHSGVRTSKQRCIIS
ncbi:hypothetical protein EB796_014526 [Bugula neritina]|uniref:Uncharacterized protein n=1 Tax=Bugula neritina TaxID=10212 RepID=A0A7J7JLM3_BUGNE|nr:hypothetical protein EB796_014526 [Bugula neritina]